VCETNPETLASTQAGTVSFHVFELYVIPCYLCDGRGVDDLYPVSADATEGDLIIV
jgi:hypothetical protein